MILLILSTTLIARMMGRENAVWGHNYVGLALMVLVVVFAGTSLGLLIAALSKTPEQSVHVQLGGAVRAGDAGRLVHPD